MLLSTVEQVAEAMLARRRRLKRFETRSVVAKKRQDPEVRLRAFERQAEQHRDRTARQHSLSDAHTSGEGPVAPFHGQPTHTAAIQHMDDVVSLALGSSSEHAPYQYQQPIVRAWGTPDSSQAGSPVHRAEQYGPSTENSSRGAVTAIKTQRGPGGRARGVLLHAQSFNLDTTADRVQTERQAPRRTS